MSFRGRGRGRGGFSSFQRDGPPAPIDEIGSVIHSVEDELLCIATVPEKVPFFNAPIFNASKASLGKVDEILGPINQVYFTVKPADGVQASSFAPGDKVHIPQDKLLPVERFLPKPKIPGPPVKKPKTKGARGGASGGFGGRGRGAPRGGFGARGRGGFRGGPPRGRGGGFRR